jgi:pimeloyl-ACP methyl ester carboxylesterase
MGKNRLGIIIIGLVIGAFLLGALAGARVSPERIDTLIARYGQGLAVHKQSLSRLGMFDTVQQTDFRGLIGIHAEADIEARRKALGAFIWRGQPPVRGRLPEEVERDVTVPLLADISSLASVDRLTIHMDLGVTSVVHMLHARANTGKCLILYHEGHGASFLARKVLIRRVLDQGCDVAALSLPLTGNDNSRPTIDHARFGRILLNDPDKFELLETERQSTIQFFLTPPLVTLNWALAEKFYERVGMIGFSGGGWVTVMAAALDPRIQRSYAVAGTAPMTVQAAKPDWGSFEQRLARLYEIANYSELYVMGADRIGRKQLQAFNSHDPCCFSGTNWDAYDDAVDERVRPLGGKFCVLSDTQSVRHDITKRVRDAVLRDIENWQRKANPWGRTISCPRLQAGEDED